MSLKEWEGKRRKEDITQGGWKLYGNDACPTTS